ncbi:MAG: nuclear transport factor 2 family protein [Bacteroidetes bacterium]|nr:nuclear transport factor 2 family protein [Bacteroidota bacterium]
MKNKVIKGVLFSCVMSFIIGCSPKKEESPATVVDTLQIKKEIQAKEDQFAATYNARELKNIGYYADDATSFSQNRAPLVGKTAIIESLKANIGSSPKSNQLSFSTIEVFVTEGGNQVVEIGDYKVIDSTKTTVNSGHYISLFVKRDGKYVCLRDMSTSDMP